MRFIRLANTDKIVLVDKNIFAIVNKYKWRLQSGRNYAIRSFRNLGKNSTISMHRHILGLTVGDKKQIDHINGNGLDNRVENLRICSQKKNLCNKRMNKNNKSGYKGVRWDERTKKWSAKISKDNKHYNLGRFDCKIEAAKAYNEAAMKYHGEFARLNEI